ncbi:hypothetical protein [Streptomyces sp. NBC_01089]|uniref:hypothetical protein n=1 Tax=Streptomyces sp. NBC_01089 TaxID=2903747 RepID=UPI0038640B0F|nr:hypothetical protein OG510_26235 [Streptomyces sp. NBC_01089]
MIIDAHRPCPYPAIPLDSHPADLDAAGVDRSVLFGTRPYPERADDLASLHREMSVLGKAPAGGESSVVDYRTAWEELDEAVAAHRDRRRTGYHSR